MNKNSKPQHARASFSSMNTEAAAGSTGHWPVPGGYQPPGMGKARELFSPVIFTAHVLPVASGQWPDGTGGSPVLPMEIIA
jgi:hypothetical protein